MASSQDSMQTSQKLRYVDVGVNLTDPIFRGRYHGKQVHADDFDNIISRATKAGCVKFMVTGSTLDESHRAIELAKQKPGTCFATAGIHPCSSKIFSRENEKSSPEQVIESLRSLISTANSPNSTEQPISAFGEFGLDYDRLQLCPEDLQRESFAQQLKLAASLEPTLPLFLHSRAAHADFISMLRPHLESLPKRGLVHSFTGTVEEMRELVELGFDIGVNGCSFKTDENLTVVREIPLERLQVETDAPWCEIRPSHAGFKLLAEQKDPRNDEELRLPKAVKKEKWSPETMVKGRNEPCTIPLVVKVVAAVKGLSEEEVAKAAWDNSIRMFKLGETSHELHNGSS